MLLLIISIFTAILPVNADVFKADPSRVDMNVVLEPVNDRVWTHTGAYRFESGSVPATGLIVLTDKGLVLVDTLWNDAQTELLLSEIDSRFHLPVLCAIITHAHADKIGGIAALKKHGIKTISTPRTAELAEQYGFDIPLPEITGNVCNFKVDGLAIEVFYPGPAHTVDNIVVYFPSEKILYAGCIIKEISEKNLGNTADGDKLRYASSVEKIIRRYPGVKHVIITHGARGGKNLLLHTYKIANESKQKGK